MKKIFLLSLFLSCYLSSKAQLTGYYQDAIRFSAPTTPFGTARIQGLGGAQTAIGTDISCLAGNPAGLALMNRGEVSITGGLQFNMTKSNYLGKDTKDNKGVVTLPTLGFVFGIGADGDKDLSRVPKFAIGLTRTNNFQQAFSYEGLNKISSITDNFVESANGTPVSVYDVQARTDEILTVPSLAHSTFLINDFASNPRAYYTTFRTDNTADTLVAPIYQRETVNIKGGETKISMAYADDINKHISFGLGAHLGVMRYISQKSYVERLTVPALLDGDLENFTITDYYKISGAGFGLSAGVIIKANDKIRIGASIATPTWYFLSDSSATKISANTKGYELETREIVPTKAKFSINTPFKASGGIVFVLGKFALLTADADYFFYQNTQVAGRKGLSLGNDNAFVQSVVRPFWNFKGGIEFRIENVRLRGGVAYFQSNIKPSDDNVQRDNLTFTGGFGARFYNFYFDLVGTYGGNNGVYTPYVLNNQQEYFSVTTRNYTLGFGLTGGIFF